MTENPRTRNRHRAGPLRLPFYPATHPVHVTLTTFHRRPRFTNPDLAAHVFRVLRSHERTLCAVVMPDHVHWVLDRVEETPDVVRRFKSLSNRLAWDRGFAGRLWQRSYFDKVLRGTEELGKTIRQVLANPLRAGLVKRPEDYPWACDRFGLGTG